MCRRPGALANHILACISTVYQQVRENGPFYLFCTYETTSGVLHPDWGSPAQERCGHIGPEQDKQKICRMVEELEHRMYENRLRNLGLFNLEKRR